MNHKNGIILLIISDILLPLYVFYDSLLLANRNDTVVTPYVITLLILLFDVFIFNKNYIKKPEKLKTKYLTLSYILTLSFTLSSLMLMVFMLFDQILISAFGFLIVHILFSKKLSIIIALRKWGFYKTIQKWENHKRSQDDGN